MIDKFENYLHFRKLGISEPTAIAMAKQADILCIECKSAIEAIFGFYVWADTEEGHDYWSDLAKQTLCKDEQQYE